MIASMLCSIFELEHTNNVHKSHACSNFEPPWTILSRNMFQNMLVIALAAPFNIDKKSS